MSLYAMPMIIVNMGVEMMYILEQRLTAQNIATDKGGKVLTDIAACMFNKDYIKMIFQPQELYTVQAVRKIFERLAHSSIMRLSDTSMDKLYDLMVMGFKYQLICSANLATMLQVTRQHLSQLRGMLTGLADASAILESLTQVEQLLNETYGKFNMGALHLLRQTLLRFLQDRRIKVSLFLQEGIQSTAGRLILHNPGSNRAGTVTYYDGHGGMEAQERIKLKALEFEPVEFFIHPVALGTNLYNTNRQKVVPPARKGDALTAPLMPADDLALAGENKAQYAEDYRLATKGVGAQQELNLLSALLAMKPKADNFKLSLFERDEAGPTGQGGMQSLTFGQGGGNRYKEGMMAALSLDERPANRAATAKREGAEEEEDLLDLLG